MKVKSVLLSLLPALLLSCVSTPASNTNSGGVSAAEAQAAAQAALDRMDGRAPAAPANSSPRQSSSAQAAPAAAQGTVVNTSRTRPAWVDAVDSVYSRAQYAAVVGHASNREMAERNALANLVAFFGQSIQADQTITNTYQEAVRSGVVAGWTDNTTMQNTIRTSASMDTLLGAEIKEVWHDTRGNTHYAVAVMEKQRTVRLYGDLILANQALINNLITMSAAEKNTLEGYARFYFAATVADMNTTYGNVIKLVGAEPPTELVNSSVYRLEAQNIARAIPVAVRVTNDRAGRVQGAFAKALSDLGFRTGGNNSRYVLDVSISLSPVTLANNTNSFARIEIGANLTDTSTGAIVLPYNFNNRDGHTSMAEAENRAFLSAERLINNGDPARNPPLLGYSDHIKAYLSQLLPQR
jgi:hypothetical protein